ncbi:MAG: hypothetical protein FJ202_05810 [Gemmatimonadetes bacterium]|nr:hypothetical protein [Gemmatimonadota bacterium]
MEVLTNQHRRTGTDYHRSRRRHGQARKERDKGDRTKPALCKAVRETFRNSSGEREEDRRFDISGAARRSKAKRGGNRSSRQQANGGDDGERLA